MAHEGTATATLDGWCSTHWHDAEGAIGSEQRALAPRTVVELSDRGATLLGSRYWHEVGRASRGIVRARTSSRGVVLRLAPFGPALLVFGPQETAVQSDKVSCRYPIVGGVLARRPGGALTLSQRGGETVELVARVNGFHPRLAVRPGRPRWSGALYEQIQARMHVAISRRYFGRLLAEATA